MSRRTQENAPAAICSRATGASYRSCLEWQRHGVISRNQPVPDAGDAAQRSFEAHVAFRLAVGLSDLQLDGAVMAVVKAIPMAGHLDLEFHPQMAKRALFTLVPAYDTEQDYHRGVPCLRVERDVGALVLRDRLSDARIRVTRLPSELTDSADLRNAITRTVRKDTVLLRKELRERGYWSKAPRDGDSLRMHARDWLLSRLLRRPCLLSETGAAHGWVNSYTHNIDDLVLQWCCGPEPAEIIRKFSRSGLDYWPGDPDYAGIFRQRIYPDGGGGDIGGKRLVFRRIRESCGPQSAEDTAHVHAMHLEWYQ